MSPVILSISPVSSWSFFWPKLAICPHQLTQPSSTAHCVPCSAIRACDAFSPRQARASRKRHFIQCESETYREHLSSHLDLWSNFFDFFGSKQITLAAEMQRLVASPQQSKTEGLSLGCKDGQRGNDII